MKFVLLLGAGFSRNWGGWLANEVNGYLPTSPAIRANADLQGVLRKAPDFETALAVIQRAYAKSPTTENLKNLQDFQQAISEMFTDMDHGYASRPTWDFSNDINFKISGFLARFDAIFSLNQDLLIERHYHSSDLALAMPRKWNGWEAPGIKAFADGNAGAPYDRAKIRWTPLPQPFGTTLGLQPFFKLHGSSNWWANDGAPMLIMGGDKVTEIQRHPLLNWYQEQFENHLIEADSRLMVIGYGFNDRHINETLAYAKTKNPNLSMFVIDPSGRNAVPAILHDLIDGGTSTRLLKDTFAGDEAERIKLYNFFKI